MMPVSSLLDTLTTAWNEQDIDTILSLFADDGTYHEPAGPENPRRSHTGHAAIRAALEHAFAAFPDGAIVPTGSAVITGDRACAEWDFEFSGKGGKKMKAHGVDVFTCENGTIKHKHAFLKQHVAGHEGGP